MFYRGCLWKSGEVRGGEEERFWDEGGGGRRGGTEERGGAVTLITDQHVAVPQRQHRNTNRNVV